MKVGKLIYSFVWPEVISLISTVMMSPWVGKKAKISNLKCFNCFDDDEISRNNGGSFCSSFQLKGVKFRTRTIPPKLLHIALEAHVQWFLVRKVVQNCCDENGSLLSPIWLRVLLFSDLWPPPCKSSIKSFYVIRENRKWGHYFYGYSFF